MLHALTILCIMHDYVYGNRYTFHNKLTFSLLSKKRIYLRSALRNPHQIILFSALSANSTLAQIDVLKIMPKLSEWRPFFNGIRFAIFLRKIPKPSQSSLTVKDTILTKPPGNVISSKSMNKWL